MWKKGENAIENRDSEDVLVDGIAEHEKKSRVFDGTRTTRRK